MPNIYSDAISVSGQTDTDVKTALANNYNSKWATKSCLIVIWCKLSPNGYAVALIAPNGYSYFQTYIISYYGGGKYKYNSGTWS